MNPNKRGLEGQGFLIRFLHSNCNTEPQAYIGSYFGPYSTQIESESGLKDAAVSHSGRIFFQTRV